MNAIVNVSRGGGAAKCVGKKVSKCVAGDGCPILALAGFREVVLVLILARDGLVRDGGWAQNMEACTANPGGHLWESLRFSEVENTGTTFCVEGKCCGRREKDGVGSVYVATAVVGVESGWNGCVGNVFLGLLEC